MSGFFGFDTALPGRTSSNQPKPFGGFAGTENTAFSLAGAGQDEDHAVYNWDDNIGNLMDEGDTFNDDTFGDVGPISNDFQFSQQHAPSQPKGSSRGPVASTQSRYKPKVAADPFAFSESDFYSNKKTPSSSVPRPVKPVSQRPAPPTQTAPAGSRFSQLPPPTAAPHAPAPQSVSGPPRGQIKTLEEIEAEMSRMSIPQPPPQQMQQPSQPSAQPPQMLSLEEIERQMMASEVAPTPSPGPPAEPASKFNLAGSGYGSQQALLDSMFPELSKNAPLGQKTAPFPGAPQEPPKPSPEEQAAMHALHERISAKIEAMAKFNHLMGNSDKDFITRIQLSQLVTQDPYASDFYAQVFSALRQRNVDVEKQKGDGPSVVQVAPGFALGVSGPANRFGKMGQATMAKLSGQVKKLVESRASHQKTNTAALQGALGKVSRGNVAAPRPVLAVPTVNQHRPTSILNNASVHRSALTKKQVLFALEELYDQVLELEQMRREMPRPTDMEDVERWNERCGRKVDEIWRRLMVMEPLDVSNPHPFISLMNPAKGQKLFPRLLRHLSQQQSLTLLTLLIATYPQLDVVSKAPPPPATDSSLLTKADRLDRAKREAETDNFLHCVVPGLDMLIQRCNLGLVAGLLGLCTQRMEVWKVACTRPGVALFTALLSKAQNSIRVSPDQQGPPPPDPAEVEQWNKTYAYFLSILLPHLAELFPSSAIQRNAFGPGTYLMNSENSERDGLEIEKRDAEVWGFTAALAVNAPEEEQTNLVAALREKILHTVQSSRVPGISQERRELKLRNVNMFLNGLGLDASMIE